MHRCPSERLLSRRQNKRNERRIRIRTATIFTRRLRSNHVRGEMQQFSLKGAPILSRRPSCVSIFAAWACRASGALLHISRVRSPRASRRALLFSSLKDGAFATVVDLATGTKARGRVASVDYASGMTFHNRSHVPSPRAHRAALGSIHTYKSKNVMSSGSQPSQSLGALPETGAMEHAEQSSQQVQYMAAQEALRMEHLPRLLQVSGRMKSVRTGSAGTFRSYACSSQVSTSQMQCQHESHVFDAVTIRAKICCKRSAKQRAPVLVCPLLHPLTAAQHEC